MNNRDFERAVSITLSCKNENINPDFKAYVIRIFELAITFEDSIYTGKPVEFNSIFVAKCIVDWELITGKKVVG